MASKTEQIADGIRKAMEHADDWEKKKTNIPGIFLVRMPEKDLKIMLMFNPPGVDGGPTKKKGLYFADQETVEAARKAFPHPSLPALVEAVAKINERAGKKTSDGSDVFEV